MEESQEHLGWYSSKYRVKEMDNPSQKARESKKKATYSNGRFMYLFFFKVSLQTWLLIQYFKQMANSGTR